MHQGEDRPAGLVKGMRLREFGAQLRHNESEALLSELRFQGGT
jgi:hypothetical protein